MITVNPRLALVLSLLPLLLARVRLLAALAGGAWLLGIELTVAARLSVLVVAVVVIVMDAMLTPSQAPAPRVPSAGDPDLDAARDRRAA